MQNPEFLRHTELTPVLERGIIYASGVRRHDLAPLRESHPIRGQDGRLHTTLPLNVSPESLLENQTTDPKTKRPFDPEQPKPELVYQITNAIRAVEGLPIGGFSEDSYFNIREKAPEGYRIHLFPTIEPNSYKLLLAILDTMPEEERAEETKAIAEHLPKLHLSSEGGLMVSAGGNIIASMSPYLRLNMDAINLDQDSDYRHNIEDNIKIPRQKKKYFLERRFFVEGVFGDKDGGEKDAQMIFRIEFGTNHYEDIARVICAERDGNNPKLDIRQLLQYVRPTYKILLFDHFVR